MKIDIKRTISLPPSSGFYSEPIQIFTPSATDAEGYYIIYDLNMAFG
jgi:hypothetical protein